MSRATAAPFTEVRDNLSSIIDGLVATGGEFVVTRHGKPAAVILAHDDYEDLIETLNILNDDDAMSAIREAREDMAAGRVD
jgi:antitoxin YefM